MTRVLVVPIVALLASACTVQADSSGTLAVRTLLRKTAPPFHWTGVVQPGTSIEVKGVLGDVTVKPASGNAVDVIAVRSARRSRPESVRLETVEHSGGVTICAVYAQKKGDPPNTCRPGTEGRLMAHNSDVAVRFEVRVPAGVRLVARTVTGDIDASALQGPVSLVTVNGSVTFSTAAFGEAQTVNGSINGRIGAATWTEPLVFRTVNGSVRLALPEGLNTTLQATALNGEIFTDFPVTPITSAPARRRIDGVIGSGGRSLAIETVNGSVRLRRR